MNMSWRNHSRSVESMGLNSSKASSLGDLHRRRAETQGQFFTPEWVSMGIWETLVGAMEAAKAYGINYFSVMDTSVGSGRLFEGCPTKDVRFLGLDTDHRCISALSKDAAKAGIMHEFLTGSIADLSADNISFAVINPPFSIQLDSPNLQQLGCNHFGKHGRGSSAISHEYALLQALNSAYVVAAILPLSMDGFCRGCDGLTKIAHLPSDTFMTEGANVNTAVYFFVKGFRGKAEEFKITSGGKWPTIEISPRELCRRGKPDFRLRGVDFNTPVITLAVTGDRRVEIHHHNRKIVLKYACGLVQAKVANGLLMGEAISERLPSSIHYAGDGCFLIDVLLMQENPEIQLDLLKSKINDLGGEAWISPTLAGYYRKLLKKHKRAITPMHRVVKLRGKNEISVSAKVRTLLNPRDFNSPSIKKGEILKAIPNGGEYTLLYNEHSIILRRDELLKRFDVDGESDILSDGEWSLLHEGLNHHFPLIAHQHRKAMVAMGIDWLADFQVESVVEGLISPYGYIGGWMQGSGKSRAAIALALLHEGNNMIAIESGLLPEMVREFTKLGIDQSLWKVLNTGDRPDAKINLVTYRTLRKGHSIAYNKMLELPWNRRNHKGGNSTEEIVTKKVVRTNAEMWRRQINLLICDEGSLLSNTNTQQSRAVKKLAARKLVIFDGTPQKNYPRNTLPLAAIAAGNGVAHQPFGVKDKPLVTPQMAKSANYCQRGEDAFFDKFVVTQWVTNEFRDEMQSGGKREVPKINNLSLFRSWLAPNLQRRVREEPDLAIFNNCPAPQKRVIEIDWADSDHFAHYLKVATEFAAWYRGSRQGDRSVNLVSVLARIGAVQRAANSPHVSTKATFATYAPITDKQKLAVQRVQHWVKKGKKVILYASSPDVLERLKRELTKINIESVLFTGKQNIKERARELDEEFRFGKTPVLLSSWVGQRGLNLEQAGVVIFYERDWSASTENQAIYRTQRPTQTQTVQVEYLHLKGSIDVYCAQLVEWKEKAADAGLDYGDQVDDEEEFLHLDTLLHRFCDEVLNMSAHSASSLLAGEDKLCA
jgi:hypothetical protein